MTTPAEGGISCRHSFSKTVSVIYHHLFCSYMGLRLFANQTVPFLKETRCLAIFLPQLAILLIRQRLLTEEIWVRQVSLLATLLLLKWIWMSIARLRPGQNLVLWTPVHGAGRASQLLVGGKNSAWDKGRQGNWWPLREGSPCASPPFYSPSGQALGQCFSGGGVIALKGRTGHLPGSVGRAHDS